MEQQVNIKESSKIISNYSIEVQKRQRQATSHKSNLERKFLTDIFKMQNQFRCSKKSLQLKNNKWTFIFSKNENQTNISTAFVVKDWFNYHAALIMQSIHLI